MPRPRAWGSTRQRWPSGRLRRNIRSVGEKRSGPRFERILPPPMPMRNSTVHSRIWSENTTSATRWSTEEGCQVVQFDVFVNPIAAAGRHYPFVVVLQWDFVDGARERIVAPLGPRN